MHLVVLIVLNLPFYCCRIFIFLTRSEECVRDKATIKDRPALASHADSVRRIRLFDKTNKDFVL